MQPTHTDIFPPVESATPDGLLAIGGNLRASTLLHAYCRGIFPWFSEGEPILWWSPDPRCVIFPHAYTPARSLRKTMRQTADVYQFRLDTAFAEVIRACAAREKTWITPEMRVAYEQLHQLGVAHSAEVWRGDELVGGLYGVAIGEIFFGESMFSCARDASKIALAMLMEKLNAWGFTLIDCQVSSPHLLRLGATEIARADFLRRLQHAVQQPKAWRRA